MFIIIMLHLPLQQVSLLPHMMPDECASHFTHSWMNIVKKPTRFQSTSTNCIDLILTNDNEFFQNSNVLEIGISDN